MLITTRLLYADGTIKLRAYGAAVYER